MDTIHKSAVLVVDDSRITREKMASILAEDGYAITQADSAESALALLNEGLAPDLFLLDIVMPGMDGLELCKHIKEMPQFAETPVLFVSGSTDMEPHWNSFALGAVDYIPKPFHPLELRARIRTHLALRRMILTNRKYAEEMEHLANERAQQLVHADRLSTLGALTAGVIHELKNPMTFISSNEQFLVKCMPELKKAIDYAQENGFEGGHKFQVAIENLDSSLEGIAEGIQSCRNIIENIRKFSRNTSGELQPTSIAESLAQTLIVTRNQTKYKLHIHQELPEDLPKVQANQEQLTQVLVNLIINAADAIEDEKSGNLFIRGRVRGDQVLCEIEDDGPGMREEVQEHLFEAFFTTKASQQGTGLGLSISQQIMDGFGGSISVDSSPGKGTTFTLQFCTALGNE